MKIRKPVAFRNVRYRIPGCTIWKGELRAILDAKLWDMGIPCSGTSALLQDCVVFVFVVLSPDVRQLLSRRLFATLELVISSKVKVMVRHAS